MLDTTLPPGYAVRAPTREDAAEVAALRSACQVADGDAPAVDAEEQLGDWQGLDLAEDAVVTLGPDGRIAGYAEAFNRRYVRVSVYGGVHPERRGHGLGAYLARWGEEWVRERLPRAPEGARVVVEHYIRSTNVSHRRLVESLGYAPARGIYVMSIALDEEPPAPEFPAGIAPRAFAPGRDERAAFEVIEDAFRDSWGRPAGTFEKWLAMTESERRDPGLWSLAVDETSGQIAGACLCRMAVGRGWVGSLGVRRAWRGRGLGLALLRRAFGEFHRRGVREVDLSVDAESPTGAPRLYARAGMRVTQSYALYRKEMRAGEDLSTWRKDEA